MNYMAVIAQFYGLFYVVFIILKLYLLIINYLSFFKLLTPNSKRGPVRYPGLWPRMYLPTFSEKLQVGQFRLQVFLHLC